MADSEKALVWVRRGARYGAAVGLACGLIYALAGLWIDATTTGLNPGTALAFLAIIGMPLLFGLAGVVLALVWFALKRLLDKASGP